MKNLAISSVVATTLFGAMLSASAATASSSHVSGGAPRPQAVSTDHVSGGAPRPQSAQPQPVSSSDAVSAILSFFGVSTQ